MVLQLSKWSAKRNALKIICQMITESLKFRIQQFSYFFKVFGFDVIFWYLFGLSFIHVICSAFLGETSSLFHMNFFQYGWTSNVISCLPIHHNTGWGTVPAWVRCPDVAILQKEKTGKSGTLFSSSDAIKNWAIELWKSELVRKIWAPRKGGKEEVV